MQWWPRLSLHWLASDTCSWEEPQLLPISQDQTIHLQLSQSLHEQCPWTETFLEHQFGILRTDYHQIQLQQSRKECLQEDHIYSPVQQNTELTYRDLPYLQRQGFRLLHLSCHYCRYQQLSECHSQCRWYYATMMTSYFVNSWINFPHRAIARFYGICIDNLIGSFFNCFIAIFRRVQCRIYHAGSNISLFSIGFSFRIRCLLVAINRSF